MTVANPVFVKRLRVSYLAVHAQNDMGALDSPPRFRDLLLAPQPVAGLDLALPFDTPVPKRPWSAEYEFWRQVAEESDGTRRLPPATEEDAVKLRRAGLPLRVRASLTAAAPDPRLELYLYPFGCAALASVDLEWTDPLALSDVVTQAASLESRPATATVGGTAHQATLGEIAHAAATAACALLNAAPQGEVDMPTHRVITVIDGVVQGDPPTTMPPAYGPTHRDLHHLSNGGPALENPLLAFLARWAGRTFQWSPLDLTYVLDRGTAALAIEPVNHMPPDAKLTTSTQHRQLCLTLMHVAASASVVRLHGISPTQFNRDWAGKAADRIGRLYGPTPAAGRFWGLETRKFLDRQSTDAVEAAKGAKLQEREPAPTTYP